ncbi:SRPBCC family protein [Streptosporangium sp. NPDC051022]|uniref:SRPBCC family protein n=1 Tax=Streptosporangium sp. NPDC051022 TaxID=3155752 RepID=UPI00342A92E4
MSGADPLTARPEVRVRAPAATVRRLLTDVTAWPRIFPAVVHAERLDDGSGGPARVWVLREEHDEVSVVTVRQVVDHDGRSVRFRPDAHADALLPLGEDWSVESPAEGESLVRLDSGVADLAALRAAAEEESAESPVYLEFADSVTVAGAARDVYDFLYRLEDWPEVVPHVATASVREIGPHVRFVEIDNAGPNGPVHTTEAVRIGFPHRTIVEKHRLLPPLASLHLGRWTVEESPGGATVTATHVVVIKEAGVASVLGEGTTLAEARTWIRGALGGNSVVVAEQAREYAERRAR